MFVSREAEPVTGFNLLSMGQEVIKALSQPSDLIAPNTWRDVRCLRGVVSGEKRSQAG